MSSRLTSVVAWAATTKAIKATALFMVFKLGCFCKFCVGVESVTIIMGLHWVCGTVHSSVVSHDD
jgi:hypothetical protein